jgi:hypothetical protein
MENSAAFSRLCLLSRLLIARHKKQRTTQRLILAPGSLILYLRHVCEYISSLDEEQGGETIMHKRMSNGRDEDYEQVNDEITTELKTTGARETDPDDRQKSRILWKVFQNARLYEKSWFNRRLSGWLETENKQK